MTSKKRIILCGLMSMIMLACNFGGLATGSEQSAQVIFRSPREMNLQESEISGFEEIQPEDPISKPLFEDAIDQDQRAFLDKLNDSYLESNVIMVEEQTKREPKEIIYQVIEKRRPAIKLIDIKKSLTYGVNGTIFSINNNCCSRYNEGYALVFTQNNIIVVLTGCGSNISQDYIIYLGKIVFNRITAPPKSHEIEINQSNSLQTYLGLGISQSQASDCAKLKLTTEECINLGTHIYTGSFVKSYVGEKASCAQVEDILNHHQTITFSPDKVLIITPNDGEGGEFQYINEGINTYSSWKSFRYKDLEIFNMTFAEWVIDDDGTQYYKCDGEKIVFTHDGYESSINVRFLNEDRIICSWKSVFLRK